MNSRSGNGSIINMGGQNSFTGNAIGQGGVVNNGSPAPALSGVTQNPVAERWDIGVVTILSEEARAVHDEFGLTWEPGKVGGLFFATGKIDARGRLVKVVATRTHAQGQRSAMAACENLRKHYDPAVLLMVGIGGGIHRNDGKDEDEYVKVGDVAVATRVVFYEVRKETPQGTVRRGEEREAPAEMVHSVNMFFTVHGEPAEFPAKANGLRGRAFQAMPGTIGSGYAVIADEESEIRNYLTGFDDKVLAVDMEAGGLSQYWQENSVDPARNPGWVVVRGISDRADSSKGHSFHDLAARNAAHVARELVPYLI